MKQFNLFDNPINENEVPEGFYAVDKNQSPTANVCNSCEARKLCQDNIDNWCLINRCMSYEVEYNGNLYYRIDGKSVFFRLK